MVLYLLELLGVGCVSLARYERVNRKAKMFVAGVVVFSLVHALAESKNPAPGLPTFLLFACSAAVAFQPQVSCFVCIPRDVKGLAPIVQHSAHTSLEACFLGISVIWAQNHI